MPGLRKLAAVGVAAVAIATSASGAQAGANSDRLQAGEALGTGQSLVTSNGITLIMQGDGNLVEYAPGNRAVWSSGTNRPDSVARLQPDGNLVVIAPGNVPVWNTGTQNNPGATLELQTDGNLVVYAQGHAARWANGVSLTTSTGAQLASDVLRNSGIGLQTVHVSGVRDDANARQNIVDTAAGGPARRSAYGGAPGGTVALDTRMLSALRTIGSEGALRVSEISGGQHTSGSAHYAGRAFDLDQYGSRSTTTIVNRCRQLGASLAQFESTHVHCQWG